MFESVMRIIMEDFISFFGVLVNLYSLLVDLVFERGFLQVLQFLSVLVVGSLAKVLALVVFSIIFCLGLVLDFLYLLLVGF